MSPWHSSRSFLPILAAVWLAGAAYGWAWIDRGWVPHDEGALAQSAERVRAGELPHADFDEIYTGGLSWAHAAVFELLGVRLIALRWALLAAFVAWIPVVFWIATRFVPPWLAGLVTALAAAGSVPSYAAAVPSWYVLFLATFALAAAMRYAENGRRRWLWIAGLCSGIAMVIKVVGLYLLAALLVWLAFVEQGESEAAPGEARGRGWLALLAVGAAVLLAAVVAVVRGDPGVSQALHFVLPPATIALLLIHLEWRVLRAPFASRTRRMASLAAPVLAGAALPVAVFLAPYAAAGELEAVFRGVFLDPQRRFDFATFAPPSWRTALWMLPPALILAWALRWPAGQRVRSAAFLAALLVAVLLATGEPEVYRAVWRSMRWSIPAVVLVGAVALARSPSGGAERAGTLALLSGCALLGLVQFPFASPVYFLYVAPLALLAATAVVARAPRLRPAFALVVLFYLGFSVTRITPGYIYAMGHVYRADQQTEPLGLERGGIRVSADDRETYGRVVERVEREAGDGALWAAPDSPEVYFLSGRPNVTRSLFDFTAGPPPGEVELLEALERLDVRVVVLNTEPAFSPPLSARVRRAVGLRYPRSERVGRFEVRWRR